MSVSVIRSSSSKVRIAFAAFLTVVALVAAAAVVPARALAATPISSMGYTHTVFVNNFGSMYTAGYNYYGQLADNNTSDAYKFKKVKSNIKAAAAGQYFTTYVTKSGVLYGVGSNSYGQLGTGDTETCYSPVKIATGVSSVAAGNNYTAYISGSGDLLMVGNGSSGKLGNGSSSTTYYPVRVATDVKSVSLGTSHSAYITKSGDLYTFGSNGYGQLGTGSKLGTSDMSTQYKPIKIASGVKSVVCGPYNTAYITKSNNLYICGYNYYSICGENVDSSKLYPSNSNYVMTPVKVCGGVTSAALGYYHLAYVTTAGNLWTKGYNYNGQLGTGDTNSRTKAAKVATGVSSVSAGYYSTSYLSKTHRYYTFGYNYYGQIASGDTIDVLKPAYRKNLFNQKISLQKTSLNVTLGRTATNKATAKSAVSYSSSNSSVASVNSKGVVTGKKIGSCTITVKAKEANGYYSAKRTYKVNVSLPAISTLKAKKGKKVNKKTRIYKISWSKPLSDCKVKLEIEGSNGSYKGLTMKASKTSVKIKLTRKKTYTIKVRMMKGDQAGPWTTKKIKAK